MLVAGYHWPIDNKAMLTLSYRVIVTGITRSRTQSNVNMFALLRKIAPKTATSLRAGLLKLAKATLINLELDSPFSFSGC